MDSDGAREPEVESTVIFQEQRRTATRAASGRMQSQRHRDGQGVRLRRVALNLTLDSRVRVPFGNQTPIEDARARTLLMAGAQWAPRPHPEHALSACRPAHWQAPATCGIMMRVAGLFARWGPLTPISGAAAAAAAPANARRPARARDRPWPGAGLRADGKPDVTVTRTRPEWSGVGSESESGVRVDSRLPVGTRVGRFGPWAH